MLLVLVKGVKLIDKAYNQDVVQRLLKLIDFRNDYPAFDGNFTVEPSNDTKMILTWKKDDKRIPFRLGDLWADYGR